MNMSKIKLQKTSLFLALLLLGAVSCKEKDSKPKVSEDNSGEMGTTTDASTSQLGGLALYTVRDAMAADTKATLKAVAETGYVNIEAAGTRVVDEIFSKLDYISFDYKTPSTGVKTRVQVLNKLIQNYPAKFQIKAVIETEQDYKSTVDMYNELLSMNESLDFVWCLTPSYNLNEEFPLERFRNVIKWNEEGGSLFRVIGQQHKWLFGPDEKQV